MYSILSTIVSILSTKKIFISFIEECIMNPDYYGYVGGRIEVYRKGPYADEEIRFFTDKVEKFNAFRDAWDMKDVNEEELQTIRKIAQSYFMRV